MKEAKHAEDTWKQKSGDSEDIAMLYLAMVRAAGLTAFAMKVVARDRAIFDPSYMNMDQLDDTVVLLGIDGKGVLVDPGEKMAPFGTLNWRHSDAGGLRQSARGAGLSDDADPALHRQRDSPHRGHHPRRPWRNDGRSPDCHGWPGGAALAAGGSAERRNRGEESSSIDELEAIVPEGVEAHVDHFLGLDDPDSNLMAMVKVHGTLGTATSKRLLLPGFFFEARGHTPFVSQEKRLEPVDMHYGDREMRARSPTICPRA